MPLTACVLAPAPWRPPRVSAVRDLLRMRPMSSREIAQRLHRPVPQVWALLVELARAGDVQLRADKLWELT